MTRPLLLDLFCGAGGASVGYHRAGFDVVGVDIVRQPHYPLDFRQYDALWYLEDVLRYPFRVPIAAIHASPPCKRFTVANRVSRSRANTLFDPHPDLLAPTLELLATLDIPWVVENVPGAPMPDPVTYCGSSFGLRVRRHRLFSSNVPLTPPPCDHAAQGQPVGVYGNGGAWTRTAPGGGGVKVAGKEAADALGVDWTDYQPALSQMIPPAYTEHIGRQLIAHLSCADTSPADDRATQPGTHHTSAPRCVGDGGPLRTSRTVETPGEPSALEDEVGHPVAVVGLVERITVAAVRGDDLKAERTLTDDVPGVLPVDGGAAGDGLLDLVEVVEAAHENHSTTNATWCQPQMFGGVP